MRAIVWILAAMVCVPSVAQARLTPEVRPIVGAFVPTGAQKNLFKNSVLTGAQFAIEADQPYHLVGSFSFTGPDFAKATSPAGHMHIFQADLGGELFKSFEMQSDWKVRPFIGAGLGMRVYDPIGFPGHQNYPAGYGSLGTEVQSGAVALRLEGRNYISRYRGLTGSDAARTRDDFALTAGLSFHLR